MDNYGNTLFEIALTYQNKEHEKYITLLEQAANHNNKHALFRLAVIYLNGYGVKRNILKCNEYLLKAIEFNSTRALYLLANLYEKRKLKCDNQEIIELYQKAVQRNHKRSMHKLALHYLKGDIIAQDIPLASKYYTQLINDNYLPAILSLAKELIIGQYISKNIDQAISLLKLGVSLNSADAMYLLAHFYILGIHVSRNHTYARQLIENAFKISKKPKIGAALSWLDRVNNFKTNNDYKNINFIVEYYPYLKDHMCTLEDIRLHIKNELKDKTDSYSLILYALLTTDKEEKISTLRKVSSDNGYASCLLADLITDIKEKEILYAKATLLNEQNALRRLVNLYYNMYNNNTLEINITDQIVLKKIIIFITEEIRLFKGTFGIFRSRDDIETYKDFGRSFIIQLSNDDRKNVLYDILNTQVRKDDYTIHSTINFIQFTLEEAYLNDTTYTKELILKYEEINNYEQLNAIYETLLSTHHYDIEISKKIISHLKKYNIKVSSEDLEGLYNYTEDIESKDFLKQLIELKTIENKHFTYPIYNHNIKHLDIDLIIHTITIYDKLYPNDYTNYTLKKYLINECNNLENDKIFEIICLLEKEDGKYDYYHEIKPLYTKLIKEHYNNPEYIKKIIKLLKQDIYKVSNDDLIYLHNLAKESKIELHYIETLKWIIDFNKCSYIYDQETTEHDNKNINELVYLFKDSRSIDLYKKKYIIDILRKQQLVFNEKASNKGDGEATYQLLRSKYYRSYSSKYSTSQWDIEEINRLFYKAMLQNHIKATLDYAKWYLSLDSVSIKKFKLNENLETIIKYFEKTYHKNNPSDIAVLAKLYMKNQQFQQMIDLYEKTSYLIDSALQCILIYHKGLYKQKKDIKKAKEYIELANSIDKDKTKAFLIKNSITC